MVLCWCLQDPRQMVSHRWMPWAGRSATTAIALVAGSLPQLTVWPGHLSLSLSPFCRFFPVWTASCGWLLKSQPFWLQHSRSQHGWKAECKMERKGRRWRRSFEGRGQRRIDFWVLSHAMDVIGKGASGDLMEPLWFLCPMRLRYCSAVGAGWPVPFSPFSKPFFSPSLIHLPFSLFF